MMLFRVPLIINPKYEQMPRPSMKILSNQLDTAATSMTSPAAVSLTPKSDVMFDGDNASWITFANTLRLRLLIRQTQMCWP